MLGLHVFLLSEPDAVLARHRPAEFDRHQVERLGQLMGTLEIGWFIGADQYDQVEISVADMTQYRRHKPGPVDFIPRPANGLGKAGDRHAAIRDVAFRTRRQRLCRVIGVMPRLPQSVPVFGAGRPGEIAAAMLRGNGGKDLDLFCSACFAAMEFQEKVRCLRQLHVRIINVHAAHLDFVQKLYPCHRQTGLHGLHHRLNSTVHIGKGAGRSKGRFRLTEQADRKAGDNPERSLRPHKKMRQIVSCRGFARPRTGFDYLAVRKHDLQRQHIFAHRAIADGVGTRGTGRRHATDRRVGARINGEHQTGRPQRLVQLVAGHAGLDDGEKIALIDLEDPVHAAQIDADTAVKRHDMTLQRGSDAERHHRTSGCRACFHDGRDLIDVGRKGNGVGQYRR